MVKRILTFFNKEFHGVNEAALLLGGFSFVSQLLGLLRDRTLAHVVGAGPILDTYYAAFRIPDFLYLSIASLASITVLMPFLVDKMDGTTENTVKARRFLNNVFSAYMIFMVGICIVIAILMPTIAHYVAPGFSPAQLTLLTSTSRIMLFSPIFIGLSNLIGTVTQLFKNFFIFSLSPIFYNIGILFGVAFLYPVFGVYGLAGGVIIGALMHLLIQIPTVYRHGFLPTLVTRINWREIFNVVRLSAPRTLTLSCNSLAFIALIALASTFKSGSISLFTFAYNIQSDPVAVIGISYSVAAFPMLVQSFSRKDMGNFIGHTIATAKQMIFWSLPAITLIVVLRAQIVRVVLGSNTFSWADTRLTAAATAIFIISLAAQGLVLLLVRAYYAAGNTKKPLVVNVFSSVMLVFFGYAFVMLFRAYPSLLSNLETLLRVKDVPGTIMLALPLAYTLGSILNFFLIWIVFKKDFLRDRSSGLWPTFWESTAGALTMGIVTYVALNVLDDIFIVTTGVGILLQGLLAGLIGIIFGMLVLALLKNQQMLDLTEVIGKKLSRDRVLVPEQKEL
jgi:putative peptidoglycan lipid II flippase